MENNYKEIKKELESAKKSLKTAQELLPKENDVKTIKTVVEFEDAIIGTARLLSKSDNESTFRGMKHRIENGKKKITVQEAYEIQEKFGIPVYAWKNIQWFKKNLKPT